MDCFRLFLELHEKFGVVLDERTRREWREFAEKIPRMIDETGVIADYALGRIPDDELDRVIDLYAKELKVYARIVKYIANVIAERLKQQTNRR